MVIIFIGPPGSGKGTQAQVLKDTVLPNLHILTVSSLLKEKSSDGSVLGNEIKQKMDNGALGEWLPSQSRAWPPHERGV